MNIDLEELKRLALAATPGEWTLKVHTAEVDDFNPLRDDWTIREGETVVAWEQDGIQKQEDVRYIAAANPAVILELIAEIERLQVENAGLKADAGRYRFIRSQFSPIGLLIHGIDEGLALYAMDKSVDAEMKDWDAARTTSSQPEL